MPDIDGFLQDVREAVHKTIARKKDKQPAELADLIIEEIRKSVKKLVSKEAPIITLENAKIYIENGRLHFEAWNTNLSVTATHTEFGTGNVHVSVALAKEDIDKILQILTIRTSKELQRRP